MFEITPYLHRSMNRYNPFRELDEIERTLFGKDELATFKTDIRDCGDAYKLEADLPGFDKDSIHVDIENGCLTVSAERRSESEKKDKNNNVIYSERSFGSFSRSFDVSGVNENDITAEYKDGVLTLTMPKKAKETPTSRRLTIQ